ncbi:MAG: class I SAM-dependent methyltransferase [Lachnospiraceae bacterium]|nr:class I SAM-dependent methyltransferase [Lachnospiraceae bacterium]MDO4318781.1 class I SAM-dependent methyltransferase [Lachnospiraceae bacterium]
MLDSSGFDLWANGYDQSVRLSEEAKEYPFAGYKDVLNRIYNRIRKGNGKKILDIGFGTGILAKKLYDDGVKIYGMDFSPEMLRLAGAKMPNAVLLCHDFSKGFPSELEDEKFDFIICTYAIHHLTEEEKTGFLQETKKYLVPGGEILVGDVAFETRRELDECRQRAGEEWDDEECYLIAEELAKAFPDMEFERVSYCSGICRF